MEHILGFDRDKLKSYLCSDEFNSEVFKKYVGKCWDLEDYDGIENLLDDERVMKFFKSYIHINKGKYAYGNVLEHPALNEIKDIVFNDEFYKFLKSLNDVFLRGKKSSDGYELHLLDEYLLGLYFDFAYQFYVMPEEKMWKAVSIGFERGVDNFHGRGKSRDEYYAFLEKEEFTDDEISVIGFFGDAVYSAIDRYISDQEDAKSKERWDKIFQLISSHK